MLVRNYSLRTIDSYLYWIRWFILFCNKQHPSKLDHLDVERFLTFLAVELGVAPSTQALALNALIFLKVKLLEQPLQPLANFQKASRQRKLPVVLTAAEVKSSCEIGTPTIVLSLIRAIYRLNRLGGFTSGGGFYPRVGGVLIQSGDRRDTLRCCRAGLMAAAGAQ
jgi:integrase